MQDYDDQQPSEKDIVQPEDISNAPIEKCLENVGGPQILLAQGSQRSRSGPDNSDSIRVEFNKTNAEIKRLYAAKKRASWHEICIKIDARTNNSKLWSIAKSPSRDRPQVEVCNTILTVDGFPPNDDRATANILGSHYQKMSRLTFNKADKNTGRQAKSAVHKCRSSDLGDPVFLANFSMHELL
ncbi:uncharacterized protein TNCV_667261 [Trichonephila clavipes]|nr:uncharacterized protein TNCV_667261 [Trichonephila clavipes]